MAILVKPLEPSQRQRALFYGMSGAFILRAGALVSAKWLMDIWWLQFGAIYLLYIAIAHFVSHQVTHQIDGSDGSGRGFWMTIALVELTDAAFAIDSTLVAVGMSDRLWVISAGVALGILAVRYAATLFINSSALPRSNTSASRWSGGSPSGCSPKDGKRCRRWRWGGRITNTSLRSGYSGPWWQLWLRSRCGL